MKSVASRHLIKANITVSLCPLARLNPSGVRTFFFEKEKNNRHDLALPAAPANVALLSHLKTTDTKQKLIIHLKIKIMATTAKTNGTSKKETTTPKTAVKKQLVKDAIDQTKTPMQPVIKQKLEEIKILNIDDRINRFEKLRGLADQRERLNTTLLELTRFNYNQGGSSTFFLRESDGKEFKTTNTNLITLVTEILQQTLENRKKELENEILKFDL